MAYAFLALASLVAQGGGLVPPAQLSPQDRVRIGEIDFFGYSGLDLEKIRAALPIRQDQDLSLGEMAHATDSISKAVQRVTGHPTTDVATVCCDEARRWMVYVGLAGTSSKPMSFNPPPTGAVLLPPKIVKLYDSFTEAWVKAIQNGRSGEDRSRGYALSNDPDLRAKELAIRDYALQHEAEVVDVLENSANATHREAGAMILGYGDQTQRQMEALVHASRDPDSGVRNNAVRALMVLAASNERAAALIPGSAFIDMLTSGSWTDRNKGGSLLAYLTKTRDPNLMAQLRSQALPALFEMAQWQVSGHASAYRTILGRVAGLPEEQIEKLAGENDRGKALVAVAREALHP